MEDFLDEQLKKKGYFRSYTIVEFIPIKENMVLATVFVIHTDAKRATYNIGVGTNLLDSARVMIQVFKGKPSITGDGTLTPLLKAFKYMLAMEPQLKLLGMEYLCFFPLSRQNSFRYVEKYGFKPLCDESNRLYYEKRL